MFYAYLRGLVVFLLWIINGNAHYHNRDKLLNKDENYILVAPHRTWWDPVYMAFSARPKQFIFMAKKELFKSRIFGWWIRMCGAFPIDRENPGQEAIKYPVNMLKKSNRSLIMFQVVAVILLMLRVGLRLSLKWPRLRLCQLSIKALVSSRVS